MCLHPLQATMLLSQVKLLVILFITSIAIGSELEEH
jgi:hypothetical protein